MTLDFFRRLSSEVQVRYVLIRGVYLAQRWQDGKPVMLHYLVDGRKGFFVELGVDEQQTYFFVLRSFSEAEPLAEYANGVRLPKQ